MPSRPIVLAIPFHNEQAHLPRLIASLRAQRCEDIPAVFVDNGSTDASAAIVRDCPELRGGGWHYLQEPRVGKFFALRAAAEHCVAHFGCEFMACVDADSVLAAPDWLARAARLAAASSTAGGYLYSTYRYFGHEHLPVFAAACEAHAGVLDAVVERVGWIGNGQGAAYHAEVLREYFAAAAVTTEIDLRLSLLALARSRIAVPTGGVVRSSARRIVRTAADLRAWSFYDHAFYDRKDLNDRVKLALDVPPSNDDLRVEEVPLFFRRRALKAVGRELVPMLLADRSDGVLARLGGLVGEQTCAELARDFADSRGMRLPILNGGFQALVDSIERHPAAVAMARHLEEEMVLRYTASPSRGGRAAAQLAPQLGRARR